MKGSQLLGNFKLDNKIQQHLKVLEFAAQYNLRKAYYRHSPLNANSSRDSSQKGNRERAQERREHAETADLIMELNEEIENWDKASRSQQSPKKEPPTSSKPARQSSQRSQHDSDSSSQSIKSSSKLSKKDEGEVNLDDVSNYESETTRRKLKSIAEEPEDIHSQLLKSKAESKPPTRSELIKIDDLGELSMVTRLKPKVEQVKTTANAPKSAVQHSISHSISHSKSLIEPSLHSSKKDRSTPPSNPHSFLDNTISQIRTHSADQSSSPDRSNLSEFWLMRELSASFEEGENMKTLLKLENCELEERFLERRIVSRLEKGYQQVASINDISWEGLRMPPMPKPFPRPNYAHLIE